MGVYPVSTTPLRVDPVPICRSEGHWQPGKVIQGQSEGHEERDCLLQGVPGDRHVLGSLRVSKVLNNDRDSSVEYYQEFSSRRFTILNVYISAKK